MWGSASARMEVLSAGAIEYLANFELLKYRSAINHSVKLGLVGIIVL